MSVVMTVSGKPGFASLHYVWLTFVGQTIASWCFLVSVLAPYLQKPFEPPMAVETYASRYRLLTPEPSSPRSRSCSLTDKGLTDAGGQPTNQPIVEPPQPVEEPTSGSRDRRTSKRFSFAAAGIAFYDFSVHPLRRSNSMSVVNQKKKTASTRPRSRSDPTDTKEREPHRVGRCMTIASAFAAKHTSPARPLVKRARTVFQRSLAQGNSKSSDSDSGTDVESDFVTIPRAFFQSARTGTRKAYHCSTSAATTAFRKVSPDSKAVAGDLSRTDVQKVAKGKSTGAALPATEEVPARRRRSPLCPKSFKLFSKKRASI